MCVNLLIPAAESMSRQHLKLFILKIEVRPF